MKLVNTLAEETFTSIYPPILMIICNHTSRYAIWCHSDVPNWVQEVGGHELCRSVPEIWSIMIAKLFLFWLSLAKFSFEQLFTHFDLYDAVHILLLGAIGVCLKIFERQQWIGSKKVRSSMRSPTSPGTKKRGSVSFAAGTKFYPIQSYTPVGFSLFGYTDKRLAINNPEALTFIEDIIPARGWSPRT